MRLDFAIEIMRSDPAIEPTMHPDRECTMRPDLECIMRLDIVGIIRLDIPSETMHADDGDGDLNYLASRLVCTV
jgi:hypothetical protein